MCDFAADWDVNNDDSEELFLLPSGGLMTEACAGDEIGPLRNCGFNWQISGVTSPVSGVPEVAEQTETGESDVELPDGAYACRLGGQVQLACSADDGAAPQVLRFCEYSHVLGGGTACLFQDALANGVAGGDEQEYSFTCPTGRSETEPGGAYTLYTTPLFGEADVQPVSCVAVE